ncbi:cAMP-regulated D2 protein-like [Lineus longissimus]|uniref:cAMP-regulated D2 protein-like n=1 Tax=Lineus longissimus TaxID=88925 RepID=UPI00315D8B4C
MADHTANPNDVELGERNPNMNESYADSVSTVHDEPARSDFLGMRYAEDDPTVSSMGHGDSQTDLGIEERHRGYGNEIGQRLACPPVGCSSTDGKPAVYSNPRYTSPQRSNLRRLPSLDRLPSRAASNSTVNAPSVTASNAELVDGKAEKPKDPNSPKAKIVEFFNNPKYEKPRALLLIILLLILLIIIIVLPIVFTRRGGEPQESKTPVARPLAQVSCAWIAGVYEKNISVFKGISYALAPDGRNRWTPPRELHNEASCRLKFPNSTSEIPTATDKFGSRCYQRIKNGYKGGSEDCLTLNVWTSTNKTDAGLPVIVYIHGGQLAFGGGDEIASYGVHDFVKKYKVVVVSMNYRLGPFGFMALKEFPDYRSTGMTGNYGLMDQIAALNWVKANIKKFGGAPTKVTLLGWESGGSSVLALLNSAKASNLFHGAWVMDGGFIRDQTLNETLNVNGAFLSNTGCSTKRTPSDVMDCLYAMSSDAITNSVSWNDGSRWTLPQMYAVPKKDDFMAAMITVDGNIVKQSTLQMFNTRTLVNHVPIVFGNGQEATDLDPPYFERGSYPSLSTTERVLISSQLEEFSNTLATLVDDYEKTARTHEQAYMLMVTDMRARCPTNQMVQVWGGMLAQPVYRYIFSTQPSSRIDALARGFWSRYAFRGVDMLAAFGAFADYYSNYFTGQEQFQVKLQEKLAEFATTGKIAAWNRAPSEYMVFNATASRSMAYDDITLYKDCTTFTNAGIDWKYAWMN